MRTANDSLKVRRCITNKPKAFKISRKFVVGSVKKTEILKLVVQNSHSHGLVTFLSLFLH